MYTKDTNIRFNHHGEKADFDKGYHNGFAKTQSVLTGRNVQLVSDSNVYFPLMYKEGFRLGKKDCIEKLLDKNPNLSHPIISEYLQSKQSVNTKTKKTKNRYKNTSHGPLRNIQRKVSKTLIAALALGSISAVGYDMYKSNVQNQNMEHYIKANTISNTKTDLEDYLVRKYLEADSVEEKNKILELAVAIPEFQKTQNSSTIDTLMNNDIQERHKKSTDTIIKNQDIILNILSDTLSDKINEAKNSNNENRKNYTYMTYLSSDHYETVIIDSDSKEKADINLNSNLSRVGETRASALLKAQSIDNPNPHDVAKHLISSLRENQKLESKTFKQEKNNLVINDEIEEKVTGYKELSDEDKFELIQKHKYILQRDQEISNSKEILKTLDQNDKKELEIEDFER